MNLLQKLRELRRRLTEDLDHVPDVAEHLVELGFYEDDDPELILAALDDEITALEVAGNDGDDEGDEDAGDGDGETGGGKDV